MYGKNDPERIRSVELKHASWARDLALASGAADAESVRSSFSDSAKPRSFYLQKQALTSAGSARQVPAFMDPSISKIQNSLDANTGEIQNFRMTISPVMVTLPQYRAAVTDPSCMLITTDPSCMLIATEPFLRNLYSEE
jgi:hypothetical protein